MARYTIFKSVKVTAKCYEDLKWIVTKRWEEHKSYYPPKISALIEEAVNATFAKELKKRPATPAAGVSSTKTPAFRSTRR